MKLADYIFTRLHQLGVRDIIGVPGDFNLLLLDFVTPNGLNWIGTCNELNAGYAADGYSRVRGISAMITTFGVGELSALNAIAGAYAERAPVVHIVGTPSTQLQRDGARVHHTFNDGEFRRFARLAKEVTCAQADLKDPSTATEMVDETLLKCLLHGRPVYIELPGDMVEAEVGSERLQHPLQHPAEKMAAPTELARKVLEQLYAAEKAVILVDGETRSMDCSALVRAFVSETQLPAFFTQFGKGVLDETQPNVLGLHCWTFGEHRTDTAFEEADLILAFGPHYSGTNSYLLRTVPPTAKTISLTHDGLYIRDDKPTSPEGLHPKALLAAIVGELDPAKLKKEQAALPSLPPHPSAHSRPAPPSPDTKLTQDAFYAAVNPLLRAGDVVMGETGTPSWATRYLRFPPGCQYFGATTWLSIGYMLPAALGAALARRAVASEAKASQAQASQPAAAGEAATSTASPSANARVLLFMGDGSFQMTAQDLGTMIHHGLPVTVFLVNNSGYTIERCLHGWRAPYNDVAPWKYAEMARAFGGDVGSWRIETFGELQRLIRSKEFEETSGVRFVELIMSSDDAPEVLFSLTSRPPKD